RSAMSGRCVALPPPRRHLLSSTAAPTSETYPLPLHDALPISPTSGTAAATPRASCPFRPAAQPLPVTIAPRSSSPPRTSARRNRSEEHTSELQSRENLVCRLLLEKKKQNTTHPAQPTHAPPSN